MKLIDFLAKMLVGFVVFFLGSGFVMLLLPEKEKALVEEVEVYEPVKFRAMREDGKGPTLYVTMHYGSLKISPLVNDSYDYTLGRLVYFGDEEDPIGFEMNLTDYEGKNPMKVLVHRGRPKFHTQWSYKVHYGGQADYDTACDIARKAGYNIFCMEFTKI